MTVNKERVELFVAALESDGYTQCTGQLRKRTFEDSESGNSTVMRTSHCALGVATEVALNHSSWIGQVISEENLWRRGDLHPEVAAWYGFEDPMVPLGPGKPGVDADWVGGWNDIGASFWEIAQAIRTTYLKDQG